MENGQVTHENGTNGHAHELSNGMENEATNSTAAFGSKSNEVLNYTDDFPSLPAASAAPSPLGIKPILGWVRPGTVSTNTVTSTLTLAAGERSSKGKVFGASGNTEEHKKCNNISAATETRIELSESRDGALTIVIKGARNKVEEARARLVRDLQTQNTADIDIPKDHHRKLIGQGGQALKQLEAETNCRIQIPNRDLASETIKITGPKEGIIKAIAHIKQLTDRESKLASESMMCPRMYFPFVRGPFNEQVEQLQAENSVKINIPPPSAQNEIITINGAKDGVHRVAAILRAIVADKTSNAKSVAVNVPKAQHRFIIGQQRKGIHEILKDTNVSVEVPAEEDNSDTITLRGDQSRLAEALTLVLARASSVITQTIAAPTWLHKHLIGPKGSTLQALVPNRQKVQIDFDDSGNIYLEGPPEEVKPAFDILSSEVAKLEKTMSIEKIKVHPSLHRHVIGRGGQLISKIKDESKVQITIPNEQTNSDEITIEGPKDGVKKAVTEIKAIVTKIENEKSRDIIIEQRLHKLIIGAKGTEVAKIRDQFPNVVLTFPDANKKSDVINIRGDRLEVDKVHKQLQTISKDLIESNYQELVPIFKEFHKHIIGKGGAMIRKIREETGTRIDLPDGNSGEDRIAVTGKKPNVQNAIKELEKIQNELASIVVVEVEIPVKVQSRLLGGGRRIINDIEEECGGVHIKFPAEKSDSTKVTIRGPKEDAEKAEKLLTALAKDKEQNWTEDTIKARPEFHKFLIGKGGSKITKLRESLEVRIMFPREKDEDVETIHLMGKKEDVEKAKQQLQELIKQLNETVEIQVIVDPKHHRQFLVRGAALVREIQDQNGGVKISFPKQGAENATVVTISGSKQCAENAKIRIEDIVEDMDHQTSIIVEIASHFHRGLLSNRGQKVHELQSKHNVQIRFPKRDAEETGEGASSPDAVTITGRDTKCEAAKEELLALVPISKTINVPLDAHRTLIGKGGETVRALMQDHDVNIAIPKNGSGSEEVVVTGQEEDVDSALEAIKGKIGLYEADLEDRKLRQFAVVIEIPSEYHQRIIGPRGATVNALREKHDVQISLPRAGEENPDQITVQGYESNARAAAAEIEGMIADIRSMFTQEISLDSRYHPRLIGSRGTNLRKVMEKYGVEIRLPRQGAADPNLVVIAGKDEDAVYDCIDHLRDEEENFLQDNTSQYTVQRVADAETAQKPKKMEIKGAPWQLDTEQFPDMGTASVAPRAGAGVWGAGRRW